MKKIILSLLLILLVPLMFGCDSKKEVAKNEVSRDFSNNILVLNSNPSNDYSTISVYNKNLENTYNKKINEITLGVGFQKYGENAEYLYVDNLFEKMSDKKKYTERMLLLNKKTLSSKMIDVIPIDIDSMAVDKNTVYTSENGNGYAYIYKHNINDINKDRKEFKTKYGLIVQLLLHNDSLYAVCKYDFYDNNNKKYYRLNHILKINPDTLKLEKDIPMEPKYEGYYYDSYYIAGNKLYIGISSDKNKKSSIAILNFDNMKIKYYDIDTEDKIVSIIPNNGNIYAIVSNDKTSEILKFDENSQKYIEPVSKFDFEVEKAVTLDGHIYLLGNKKLFKLNDEYKVNKDVNLIDEYNNVIISN